MPASPWNKIRAQSFRAVFLVVENIFYEKLLPHFATLLLENQQGKYQGRPFRRINQREKLVILENCVPFMNFLGQIVIKLCFVTDQKL